MNKLINNYKYYNSPIMTEIKKSHNHCGYQIIFAVKGSVNMTIDGKNYTVCAPSIILLNTFELHTLCSSSSDYTRRVLVLDQFETDKLINDDEVLAMMKYRPKGFNHIFPIYKENFDDINRLYLLVDSELNSKFCHYNTMIRNAIQSLIIYIFRINPNNISSQNTLTIQAIQNYIDTNYRTITTLTELSNKFYLSLGCISHTFKDKTGYSPKDYLSLTRLFNAQTLLINTDYSIKKICNLSGFNDINNFIRQYKKRYSLSPLQYRKEHKK